MSEHPPFPRRWLSPSLLILAALALAQPDHAHAAAGKITAQWDFDQGDLRASVGKDMKYGDGPAGRVKDHTSFGTTTSFGIPDIGGDNTGGIGISGQYVGDGNTWIIGGQWQRLVVAVDMSADTPIINYYLDGVKFGQMINGDRWGFDQRHAIPPAVRIYGDGENDNEVNTVYVNSIQFREGTMTADQAAALGAATADGIPLPASGPNPQLLTSVSGHDLTISWDPAATGYVLEGAGDLAKPTWTAVPGVVNSSVTVKTTTGTSFYRLKK